MAACGLVVLFGLGLSPARAILPDAPAPSASKPKTPAKPRPSEPSAEEEESRRKRIAACIAAMESVRQEMNAKCVVAGSTCYVKESCEPQPDGRLRCTSVNTELTTRYERAKSCT